MMKIAFFTIMGICIAQEQSTQFPWKLRGKELRDHINSHQKLWRAELPNRTRLNSLMSVEMTRRPNQAPVAETTTIAAPTASFDARTQWPNCPTIGYIRDQSECGSCWAFAAAEALSDRFCIASNATQTPVLSAQDIMTCCTGSCGSGCDGGVPYYAWEWLVSHGASTGGGYYENIGCKPYSVRPCGEHTVNNVTYTYDESYCSYYSQSEASTPACTSSCSNSAYTTAYTADKHFAKSAYAVGSTVAAIQQEIMTNGPVEAAFTVYSDFDQYVSGIYVHTGGESEGGHAVKIIGWGTDDGTDYWLVANSWDTNWGENGFFRIIRGVNECGIEDSITAGLPNV